MPRKSIACMMAVAICAPLLLASNASADSGGATITALPQSYQVEGHAEVRHECGGIPGELEPPPCSWFGEAAQYDANTECPAIYDASHGAWVGPLQEGNGISSGSFAFVPESTTLVLCLYVHDEEGSTLVGQSHPFSTHTASENLPRAAKTRTYARIAVAVFGGCHAHLYTQAFGAGGELNDNWGNGFLWGPHAARLIAASAEDIWDWTVNGPPGHYRFRERYDGDATSLPSSPVTVAFSLRHCAKHR